MVSCDIQAVVLAAGKGSRMLDLTGGGVKCLLPLGRFPLLYFPLKFLERNGFQNVLVTVPDSVKSEVNKLTERFKLSLKLEVVGIPAQEEWGTMETLRHIGDKLNGSDILIVSGDLVTRENLRKLTDLHRTRSAGLTMLLNKPAFDLKTAIIPGSKSMKYKMERDLIGLSRDNVVCLFKAEADIEDEINISPAMLSLHPRFTVYSTLQDAHLYLIKKWILHQVLQDKTLTTVKGEMVPKLVGSNIKLEKRLRTPGFDHHTPDKKTDGETEERSFSCYACITEEPTVRVNNIPSYWEGYRLIMDGVLPFHSELAPVHELARVHERSQTKDFSVGSSSNVAEKTSLNRVSIGANCSVQEKVILQNCVLMDGVNIEASSSIKDSIVCEGARVEQGCELSSCIVGKNCTVPEGSKLSNQILLDTDRMMHV